MRRLRNCNLTTVAPTGTISIIAGCSSGIEPLFAVAFMRNQAGVLMPDVNEAFVRLAKQEGWYSDALMQRIAAAGHIHFDEVPAKWQRVFVTAHDVTPEWHIQMQAAFQEFTDSAISKTCNFANDATEEYVEKIYRYAYKLGCKGVTVYRDASREMQVLSTGATAKKVKEQAAGGEHLHLARCVAVHRHALAAELVGVAVDLLDIFLGRVVREVAGLGDRRVGELLEGGLHLDVPLGGHVVRRHEHALPLRGHLVEVDVARRGDPLHERVRVPAFLLREAHESLVDVGHQHAGLVAHERDREQRLDPRRAPRDDRDRPRGRHR